MRLILEMRSLTGWSDPFRHLSQLSWARRLCLIIALALPLGEFNTAKAQSAAPALSAVDNAFIEARNAVARNDASGLAKLASQASQHGLGVYVEYWTLRLSLSQAARAGVRDPAVEEKSQQYLKTYAGTVHADLLRRDMMLYFGRLEDWTALGQLGEAWVLNDDRQVHCYQHQATVARGGQVTSRLQSQFLYGTGFGEACNQLPGALVAAGALKPVDLLPRLASALFGNQPRAARLIAGAHRPWDEALTDAAWAKPQTVLMGTQGDRDLAAILLLRWFSLDAEAAGKFLPGFRNLSPQGRQLILAFAAAQSARRMQETAPRWAQELAATQSGREVKATSVLQLPDELGAWTMRAALRASDWQTMLQIDRLLNPGLKADVTWVYWRARALKETRAPEQEWQPLLQSVAQGIGFYPILAQQELGLAVTIPKETRLSGRVSLDAQTQAVVQSAAVRRAREFYALGLRFEGNREWNWAIRGLSDAQLNAVARWAAEEQLWDRAISTAERTQTEIDMGLRFPMPFAEPLTRAAQTNQLEPELLFGLIRQESRFIQDARSTVGASGLMQVMPATGRWIAKQMGVTGFTPADLNQTTTSLNFGSFYLKTVLNSLDGNQVLATAAYNAGPGRSRAWRASLPAPLEGAAFAEIIPFNETRDYVKKVLSNTVYYGIMRNGKSESLKSRLGDITPKVAQASEIP